MSLTGKQRVHLRGLGHHVKPTVVVGKDGVSDKVVARLHSELDHHELVKLRALDTCETPIFELARVLAEATGSEVAGSIGHTALLYRRRAVEPTIVLPA